MKPNTYFSEFKTTILVLFFVFASQNLSASAFNFQHQATQTASFSAQEDQVALHFPNSTHYLSFAENALIEEKELLENNEDELGDILFVQNQPRLFEKNEVSTSSVASFNLEKLPLYLLFHCWKTFLA